MKTEKSILLRDTEVISDLRGGLSWLSDGGEGQAGVARIKWQCGSSDNSSKKSLLEREAEVEAFV